MILHLGRDSKEKRRAIYTRILSSPEATLITPEQATLDLEKDLIETCDLNGLLFHEVTSFQRILGRLMERYDCDTFLSDVGNYLLQRQVVTELKDELPLYGGSYEKEGFYDELGQILDLFRREGLDPDVLEELDEGSKGLGELAKIYKGYQEKLEEESFYLEKALELFEEKPHDGLYSTKEVWILGYKVFDYFDWRMIDSINAHTEVHLVLSYEEDHIFLPSRMTKEIAERNYSTQLIHYPTAETPQSIFARELLYDEVPKGPPVALEIFSAKDLYTEAEYVALSLLKKMKEDPSLHYNDFKIIVTDMESYDFVFRHIFTRFGLPLFSDRRRPLLESPMIRTLLSLLKLYQKGFRREEVLSFLKGYVTQKKWEDLDRFENYCFTRGIGGKAFKSPFEDADMEELRQDFLGVLLEYEDALKKKEEPTEFERILRELLIQLDFPQRLEEEAKVYEERGEEEEAQLLHQLWEAMVELLTQLSKTGPKEKLSFAAYSKLLETGLKRMSLGIIPPSMDTIRLSTLFRSTHDPVKYVYFCGLNAGALPREYTDGVLLKDEDKVNLKKHGYSFYDTFENKEELDRLDQFTALSLVEEGYFFSYALADLEGKSKIPSLFIERAMEKDHVFTSSALGSAYLKGYYELHPSMSFRYGLSALREEREEEIRGLSDEKIRSMYQGLTQPIVLPPLPRKDPKLYLSVSRLESFRRCPFQYYVNYDLKAKKRKPFKVDVLDLGNFYHEVMEEVMRAYTDGECTPDTLETYMSTLIPKLLEKEEYKVFLESRSSQYLLARSLKTLGDLLVYLMKSLDKSSFKPVYFEEKFHIDQGRVSFTGILDRVDMLDNHFMVVDYKSGSKEFDLNRVYQGVDLQLMLYIDGFTSKHPDSRPAGVFYFRLHDPIGYENKSRDAQLRYDGLFIGDEKVAEELDHDLGEGILPLRLTKDGRFYRGASALSAKEAELLLERSRSYADHYVDRIYGGDMKILPLKDDFPACQYCDYKAICRFDPRGPGARYDEIEKRSKTEIMEVLREVDS